MAWLGLLKAAQDRLPALIGVDLTLLMMGWIARRMLRRTATDLRKAGTDPVDRFAERARAGGIADRLPHPA